MIKSIFRIFMIGIISGNLLLLDYNYKLGVLGFSQASAQSSSEGIKQEESDIKDGDLLSTLTMVAIGTVTSRLMSCKATPDMIAAAAGGIAFVAGDILAYAKLKKDLKGYKEYIKNDLSAEELNHQIAIFEKIRDGYKKAISTANTKIKLQQAAAAAFVVAAGLATSFYMSVSASLKVCTGALQAASTACIAAFTASCTPTCYSPFLSGAKAFAASIPKRIASFAKYSVPGPSTAASSTDVTTDATAAAMDSSSASQCPAGGAAPAACAGYATMKVNFGGICPASGLVASSADSININDSLINNLPALKGINPSFFTSMMIKMIASEASAFTAFGIGSSMAVKFILATSKTLAFKIDTFLYNPKNRAIVWGILAALTYTASKSTGNVVSQLQSRLAKIDEIIADLKSRGLGQKIAEGTNKPGGINGVESNLAGGDVNLIPKEGSRLEGINAGKPEDISLDNELPCATKMENGQCQSFEKAFLASSGYDSLNPIAKRELLSIAKNMDGINGRKNITGASLESLGKMGGNVNALSARLANSNKELNKIAKANNESDLDKTRNDLQNDFLNSVNDELKKSGQSAQSMYASLSGMGKEDLFGTADDSMVAESETKKSGMSAEDKALLDQINAMAAANNGNGLLNSSASTLAGSEMDFSNDPLSDSDNNNSKSAASDGPLYDFNDIAKNTEKNIFDIISDRYQKTGLSRLFPKKKTQVELEKK